MNRKYYADSRGNKYCVKGGIKMGAWKASRQKASHNGEDGWKSISKVPWRRNFDEAQEDLDKLAQKCGWSILTD